MEVRFEAWTRPDTATFARRFPIVGFTQWTMKMGLFGQGLMVTPSDWDKLNDLLYVDPIDHANDKSSLIRAFVGDAHLYDFYASRISIDVNETGTRAATTIGGGPGSALERTRVRQYDYPLSPSVEPDWVYGYGPNLAANPDFDDTPEAIGNADAEDGTTLPWYTTGDPVTGLGVPNTFDAIYDAAEAHTGDWSFLVHGDAYEGVRQDFETVPDENYPITVWYKAAAGVQYRLSCDGASAAVSGTFYNGSVYVDGVGNGAYQNVGLTMTADDGGEGRIHITSRQTGGIFRFDDVTISGIGIGVSPWVQRGEMTAFEVVTTPVHDGTHSLKWHPSSGILGNDKPAQTIQVVPSSTVMTKTWVYHTEAAARDFRVVITPPGVDPNFAFIASVLFSVAPSTWTLLSASGLSWGPTVDYEVRWEETGAPTNALYLADVEVFQGHAAATPGAIVGNLIDHAATDLAPGRTALAFLTPTYTSVLDSNGNAWDGTVAITIKRGQTYRRMLEVLNQQFGYEFRTRVNPADHTEIFLDAYNPSKMGTDFYLTDGGAIGMAGVVSYGPVIKREPTAVYAMVEGSEQEWGEDVTETLRTAWGGIETYTGSTELLEGGLAAAADLLTTGRDTETVVVKFQDPPLIPGIDYTIGDKVRLTLGETEVPSGIYRVDAIAVRSGDPEPEWTVQFVSEGL